MHGPELAWARAMLAQTCPATSRSGRIFKKLVRLPVGDPEVLVVRHIEKKPTTKGTSHWSSNLPLRSNTPALPRLRPVGDQQVPPFCQSGFVHAVELTWVPPLNVPDAVTYLPFLSNFTTRVFT